MHEGFDTHQLWPFACLRCRHVWEEGYTVRRLVDDHGNEAVIWLSGGVTVPPPWSGGGCPGCGAFQVTSFPPGYLSRHPELVSAPEPAPMARPLPAVTPARRASGAWPPRSTRLLVALGLPVLAFAGYEIVQLLTTITHPH